jgi:hypothetical protein
MHICGDANLSMDGTEANRPELDLDHKADHVD